MTDLSQLLAFYLHRADRSVLHDIFFLVQNFGDESLFLPSKTRFGFA